MPRPPKDSALRFAEKMAPMYAEVFLELKADGGRVRMQSRISLIRHRVGQYVTLYDDDRRLGVALLKGLLGEKGFEELEQEVAQMPEEEREQFLADLMEEKELDEFLDAIEIPRSEQGWEAAEKTIQALPLDKQTEVVRQSVLFWAGVFGYFFNMLSLMVHGAKLTTLVPLALEGDDDAFLKAAQIDRCLVTHHPFFISRKQRAQDDGEADFLRALSYRETNPPLRGKIRYPALYVLFGALEVSGWLDSLSHDEILDLCDSAGLDRFQNRIEDVNYLTKRLREYRRWQKGSGMSMHSN